MVYFRRKSLRDPGHGSLRGGAKRRQKDARTASVRGEAAESQWRSQRV